jgi:hypothetical protein
LILSRKDFDIEERRHIEDYNKTDNVMARFVLSQIADRISIDHALAARAIHLGVGRRRNARLAY